MDLENPKIFPGHLFDKKNSNLARVPTLGFCDLRNMVISFLLQTPFLSNSRKSKSNSKKSKSFIVILIANSYHGALTAVYFSDPLLLKVSFFTLAPSISSLSMRIHSQTYSLSCAFCLFLYSHALFHLSLIFFSLPPPYLMPCSLVIPPKKKKN